ncbi:MAG: hypothetical protein JXA73_14750 [Acidobacteria bacterium]|nr:hypothetical protein [Acidobacteriota bacterium]
MENQTDIQNTRSFMDQKGWFLLGAIVVLIYFGYFALPGLNSRFNIDDPHNIHRAWTGGGESLLKGLLLFFTPYFRPMGSLYFFSLYSFFGLNPLAYHIAITVFLLINVALTYRFAVLLSNSKIVGFLCAILISYHANMSQGVYLPAFIYDVLSFTFFFAALVYYLRIRTKGRTLRIGELLIFFLLYIAALESKEMAVTLPLMVLAYEILWHPPSMSLKSLWAWIRKPAVPFLGVSLITAAFIASRTLGDEALAQNAGYRMTITFQIYFESQLKFFKELFFLQTRDWFTLPWLIGIWLILAYIAYRRRENYLKWATLLTLVGPLPIAFIPGRGGICLYIPWMGWALWLSALGCAIADYVAGDRALRFLPRNLVRSVLLLGFVFLAWHETDRINSSEIYRYQHQSDEYFFSLKTQLESLLPKVEPGTQIAFYNDGTDTWDAKFVTELFYQDRSTKVRLQPYEHLSQEELSKMDYVLDFYQRKLRILKRPGEPFQIPSDIPVPSRK